MKRNYSNWSKEELLRELDKLEKRKKYGVVWEEKSENVAELCKVKLPILEEVKKNEIQTDKKAPMNILIEGDNYHALSVLNYTHKGAIDVIYIDPPYNTGNGDSFLYNDKIVDKEDAYRHSKWLSFMSKRLNLAKNLLKDAGVIFISIDDNEVAQLKLLCNEVFGEHNFIGTVTWEKRTKAQNTETAREMFQSKTEYILAYKKGSGKIKFRLEISGEKNYDLHDEKGSYRLKLVEEMSARGMRGRQTMIFPIEGITPRDGFQWKYGKDQVKKFTDRGDIEVQNGKVYFRIRPQDETNQKFTPFWSHFFDKDTYGTAEKGKSELTEILGNNTHDFETVKPVDLIKKLLFHINRNKSEIVLDFFAGSGTTGHAVLKLNKEDGGNRKFILCTNNEGNICTDICYPRVEKVMKGYSYKDKKTAGLGGNLKYFQTDFVDAEPTDKNKRKLVDKSTEMLCLKEDCFDELIKGQSFRIFTNGQDKHLGIVYDDDGIEPFKKEVKKLNQKSVAYVFSLDDSAREEEFEDVANLVELRPIPAVILNVYRRIFK